MAEIDIRYQLYQHQNISTVVWSAIVVSIQRSVCATKLSRLCCNVWNVLDLDFCSMGLFLFDFESLIISLFSSRYPVVSPDCSSIEVYKTPEGQVKFRMLKDTEINKLMADATPKEGEEATGST